MVIVTEGHVTRRSSRKAQDLASGSGEGWRYRKHSAVPECSVSKQAVAYLGRLSRPRLTGGSLKHKGRLLRPSDPLPRKQTPFEFVMVSIPATCGIKTTSWNCNSAARINVFPPSEKKKNDSAHIWHLCIGLFWMNKKERVWYNSWWGVCVLFHATVCKL